MGWGRNTARWRAGRKGGTAVEYALIAAVMTPLLIPAFNVFAVRVIALLETVVFQ